MPGRSRVAGSLRRLAVAALAATALATALPATQASAFTAANGVRLNNFEARLVTLINAARTSRGIAPLTVTTGTTDLARKWSYAQAASNTMKHNPNLVADAERHGSPDWTRVAENVGKAYTPDSLFSAYMNSPGHRANILHTGLRYLGIGWVERPDGWGYNTQVFTNQYTSAYGSTREPAYGGRLDRRVLTETTSLGSFEGGSEPRALTTASGAGMAVGRPLVQSPTDGDQAIAFNSQNRSAGTGGYTQLRLRDSLDMTNVRAITIKLTARTVTHKPLTVELYARSVLGTQIRVGSVSVPDGPDKTVTFQMPLSARTIRNELTFSVSRAALVALSPSSYAGRSGTVYVRQITAVV
jgi:uncharacterized protein YkwD